MRKGLDVRRRAYYEERERHQREGFSGGCGAGLSACFASAKSIHRRWAKRKALRCPALKGLQGMALIKGGGDLAATRPETENLLAHRRERRQPWQTPLLPKKRS